MESATQLAAKLATAASADQTVAVAGEAFEQIRRLANDLAVPSSGLFATWASVTAAACSGRDALGAPPSVPSAAKQQPSLDHAGEDQAAVVLAQLAAILHEHLAQAAAQASGGPDWRALTRAAEAAAEILDLLAADSS